MMPGAGSADVWTTAAGTNPKLPLSSPCVQYQTELPPACASPGNQPAVEPALRAPQAVHDRAAGIAAATATVRIEADVHVAVRDPVTERTADGNEVVHRQRGRRLVSVHPSHRTPVSADYVYCRNVTGPHLHFEDHPKGPFVYAQVRKPSW